MIAGYRSIIIYIAASCKVGAHPLYGFTKGHGRMIVLLAAPLPRLLYEFAQYSRKPSFAQQALCVCKAVGWVLD